MMALANNFRFAHTALDALDKRWLTELFRHWKCHAPRRANGIQRSHCVVVGSYVLSFRRTRRCFDGFKFNGKNGNSSGCMRQSTNESIVWCSIDCYASKLFGQCIRAGNRWPGKRIFLDDEQRVVGVFQQSNTCIHPATKRQLFLGSCKPASSVDCGHRKNCLSPSGPNFRLQAGMSEHPRAVKRVGHFGLHSSVEDQA